MIQQKSSNLMLEKTVTIVGANGSGKSRLAASISDDHNVATHFIPAHRALTLSDYLPDLDGKKENSSNTGNSKYFYLTTNEKYFPDRYKTSPTELVDNFDELMEDLYSQHYSVALDLRNKLMNGIELKEKINEATWLEDLINIWNEILTLRELILIENKIRVYDPEKRKDYDASKNE